MRVLALAQRACEQGWTASITGDLDETGVAIARRLAPGVGVHAASGDDLARALEEQTVDVDVVHLDTYWQVPDLSRSGAIVSNMQDGPYGVRRADLAIDANLGSEARFVEPGLSRVQIAGLDGAAIREQVLRRREEGHVPGGRPRVLVVLGGTDPAHLTERVLVSLGQIRMPLDVTVIDTRRRPAVATAALSSPHDVTVVGFLDDLPAVARQHDFVITAAGTSVWDFACMGLPMAAICVVDNQISGYREIVGRGLVAGLGEPPHKDLATRVGALARLLGSQDERRAEAERLRRIVDGLGTWRIAAAWEQLRETPPASATAQRLSTRPATTADARMLFDWRDDPVTRAASRSREPLNWDAHVAWLSAVVADQDRQLLIVESDSSEIATVRWDRRSERDWEVSITVAPDHRGRGLAASVLTAAEQALIAERPCRLLARIHTDNTASRRLFEPAGYLPHLPADESGFRTFAKWRVRAAPSA